MAKQGGSDETKSSLSDQHDELIQKMTEAKKRWQQDDEEEDETDKLLTEAMELAIEQGKGWSPGEREAYMAKILDDDFVPPLFASNHQELEDSGLADAFSSLVYDEQTPTQLMLEFKQKGNDAFLNGKRNKANNVQYYRDAVNHYYEAFAWAQKVAPIDEKGNEEEVDEPTYTEKELDELKSTLLSNASMAHTQLKNWGFVRDDSKRALVFNDKNIKAWYRLAKAHQALQNWEEAGEAIDAGLAIEPQNKDLKNLQSHLEKRIAKARRARQQRERARVERVARVKDVWNHCQESGIQLGRVPLVASVNDEEEGDAEFEESKWHQHHPHTGRLPQNQSGEWSWPCMFLYPSHCQSDFVEFFGESEMLALRMADIFPEIEQEGEGTSIPWDYNDEFVCSNLAVYFEIHCGESADELIHPDNVARLTSQASTMRFYEASRALKGDEGPEMADLARAVERKHLHNQRKAWKKQHGSLWSKPAPNAVVRVHPAMKLADVLHDRRCVVPNFLVTFVLFPENNPAHNGYIKEHKCIGVLQPKDLH